MKRLETKFLPIILHFSALVILAVAYWSFAKGYLFGSQPYGNDYLTGYIYTDFFRKFLTWPPAGWENFWYSGISVFNGYPWPFFYFIQPLVRVLGTSWGLEIASIITFFLFFVFAYWLFWELARDRFLALLLSLLLLHSFGVFNSLPWNGFVIAAVTQMFLPLVLYLVVVFYRHRNLKLLLTAGLMNGLAILFHPTNGLILVFIPAVLILFFWHDRQIKFWSRDKIKFCFLFSLISFLIGAAVLYPYIGYELAKVEKLHCLGEACRGNIPWLLSFLNPLLYVIAGILVVILLVEKLLHQKNNLQRGLIFLVPLVYLLAFLAGEKTNLLEAISPLMWPERLIWAVGVLLGAVLAAFWGSLYLRKKRLWRIVSAVIFSGVIFVLVLGRPFPFSLDHEDWRMRQWLGPIVLDFSPLLSPLGTYPPEAYLYVADKYKKADVTTILPSWLEKDDANYRFDSLEYTVNFWWNLATDVPNTRGYVNLLRGHQSYWYGWLMSVLKDFWGEEVTRPKEIEQKTASFLIDWYAIRYSEAVSLHEPYADFILKEPFIDRKEEIKDNPVTKYPLTFYRFASELTSPIVKASRAPSLLVVGSGKRDVYDTLIRVLAAENLNSQVLMPLRGPETLEELKKYELGNFDIIFLSDYRYEDFRSWDVLSDYVKNGGNLIIDTGTEVRESDNATLPEGIQELPEVFPSKTTKRESLGTEWQLGTTDHPMVAGIDLGEFGPLLFEGFPWKLSYIPNQASLKEGAKVLLTQNGYPVLVSWKLGNGEVIWSGLNLPYHFQSYDRPTEAKLLANIISFLAGGLPKADVEALISRSRPEKVEIRGQDFSGVVFKEHFDPGWQATVNGKRVRIYSAGPDFMYVRVPQSFKGEVKVEFFYRGTLDNWFFFFLSLGSIGLTVFYLVAGGRLKFRFFAPSRRKIEGWWAKEEE